MLLIVFFCFVLFVLRFVFDCFFYFFFFFFVFFFYLVKHLSEGLTAAAQKRGIPFCAQSIGGMFGLYFSKAVPTSYAEVMSGDKEAFNRFFHAMLDAGVYLAPSAFEAGFVSAAHSDADIAATVAAADKIFSTW